MLESVEMIKLLKGLTFVVNYWFPLEGCCGLGMARSREEGKHMKRWDCASRKWVGGPGWSAAGRECRNSRDVTYCSSARYKVKLKFKSESLLRCINELT